MYLELNGTHQVTCDVTHIDDSSWRFHGSTVFGCMQLTGKKGSVLYFDDVATNKRTTGEELISINRQQIR